MANILGRYKEFASIDTLKFEFRIDEVRRKPATLKVFVGKRLTEKEIPARNSFDNDITLTIYLRGKLNEQTIAQEITALKALEDQLSHTYTDGVHDGTYVVTDVQEIVADLFDDMVMFRARLITYNQ